MGLVLNVTGGFLNEVLIRRTFQHYIIILSMLLIDLFKHTMELLMEATMLVCDVYHSNHNIVI